MKSLRKALAFGNVHKKWLGFFKYRFFSADITGGSHSSVGLYGPAGFTDITILIR
jgi:hypothetical protein